MRVRMMVLVVAFGSAGCPPGTGDTSDGGRSDAGGLDAGALDAGSTDAGTTDAGTRPIASASTFCTDWSGVWCDSLLRCGNMSPTVGAYCRSQLTRSCFGSIGARLAAGSSTLNLPTAQACLDRLIDRPCQSLGVSDESQVCDFRALLSPAAVLGGACASERDCAQGSCRGQAYACPKCIAGAAIGGLCRGTFDCDPQTGRCTETAALDGGVEWRCGLKLADGVTCSSDDDCESGHCYRLSNPPRCGTGAVNEPCSIYSDADCPAGHYCKDAPAGGTVGACTLRIADGQPCTNGLYDDGCASEGATCLSGTCATSAPGTRTAGNDCDDQYQCQSGLFCKGLSSGLSGSGTCTAWLATGAPCNLSQQNPGCAAGARCINGSCVELSPVSGPCTSSAQCGFLTPCGAEGSPSTCRAPALLGQPCTGMCEDGTFCERSFQAPGTCRGYLDAGERCSNANDVVINYACKSQFCGPSFDGGDFRQCLDCLAGE